MGSRKTIGVWLYRTTIVLLVAIIAVAVWYVADNWQNRVAQADAQRDDEPDTTNEEPLGTNGVESDVAIAEADQGTGESPPVKQPDPDPDPLSLALAVPPVEAQTPPPDIVATVRALAEGYSSPPLPGDESAESGDDGDDGAARAALERLYLTGYRNRRDPAQPWTERSDELLQTSIDMMSGAPMSPRGSNSRINWACASGRVARIR